MHYTLFSVINNFCCCSVFLDCGYNSSINLHPQWIMIFDPKYMCMSPQNKVTMNLWIIGNLQNWPLWNSVIPRYFITNKKVINLFLFDHPIQWSSWKGNFESQMCLVVIISLKIFSFLNYLQWTSHLISQLNSKIHENWYSMNADETTLCFYQ